MMTRIPKKFRKGEVYNFIQKKTLRRLACILSGKDFSCLVPIKGHKKDEGYTLELNKPEIYSTDIATNGIEVSKYGFFGDGVYIAYETI